MTKSITGVPPRLHRTARRTIPVLLHRSFKAIWKRKSRGTGFAVFLSNFGSMLKLEAAANVSDNQSGGTEIVSDMVDKAFAPGISLDSLSDQRLTFAKAL
jgi:hypothetical protein